MRILYLLYFDVDNKTQIGVSKKIGYQINAMSQLGHVVTLAFCKNNKLYFREGDKDIESFEAYEGVSHYRKALMKLLPRIVNQFDMLYIRYPGSIDYYVYSTIKRIASKVSVILEMPTYPIGGELVDYLKKLKRERAYIQLLARSVIYSMHRFYSRKLKHYLRHIVSYSDYETIWGIPVINIENGIDCASIKKRNYHPPVNNEIRLIFVAVFAKWHGLDRLISGLYNYYQTKPDSAPEVTLSLIGDSDELKSILKGELFQSVKQYVRVLGPKYGEDLDNEYNNADIAVSSLGMHRIGLKYGSTLKTREYCAKGIPFIYGYIEKGISDTFQYALRVPANDDPIDFYKVVAFFEGIKDHDFEDSLIDFSKKYDWKSQMSIVFSELSLDKEEANGI